MLYKFGSGTLSVVEFSSLPRVELSKSHINKGISHRGGFGVCYIIFPFI